MIGQTDKEQVHDRLEHQLTIKQPELLVNVTTRHCGVMNPDAGWMTTTNH